MNEEKLKLLEDGLNNGYVTVTFTKSDGSERVMECTCDGDLIPDLIKASTGPGGNVNTDVATVYERNVGWRSFRYDAVKSFVARIVV